MNIKKSLAISIIFHSSFLTLMFLPTITIKPDSSIINIDFVSESSKDKVIQQKVFSSKLTKESSKPNQKNLKIESQTNSQASNESLLTNFYPKSILKTHESSSSFIDKESKTSKKKQDGAYRKEFFKKSKKRIEIKSSLENSVNAQKIIKAKYKIGSINNPHPPYPLIARRKGMEGRLILEVLVKSDGFVKKINILKSSGFKILDNISKTTIKNWYFTPARFGGKKVEDIIEIPVKFVLSEP